MHRKSTVAAITAACLALALGAKPAHAAPPDACKLLSVVQVSAVLGVGLGKGKPPTSSNDKSCQWDAISAASSKARKGVALTLQSPSEASMNSAASSKRGTGKKTARRAADMPSDGFRGHDYYMTIPEIGGVEVPKDRSVLRIRVYGFPTDQIRTKEKILADCVLETLTNGRAQGGCPV